MSFGNDDNMLQELSDRTKHHKPVWRISRRCSSQPLALRRVFTLHTSHFTTIHSSSEYLCDSSCWVVTLCHAHTYTHRHSLLFLAHSQSHVNYSGVVALSFTRALIYGRGVILTQLSSRDRERWDQAALHLSLSTSGELRGATSQKICFRFRGSRGACGHACWARCCLIEQLQRNNCPELKLHCVFICGLTPQRFQQLQSN